MPKYQLVISKEADHDLDKLYVDGFKRWGEHSIFYRVDGDAVEVMGLVKRENRFTQAID